MRQLDPERWRRADAVFQEAIELPSEARESFLERACVADDVLLADVRALLAADADDAGILDASMQAIAASVVPVAADSAATPREDPLIGRTFGRFRIVACLGEGGMGIVYEAEQEEPRRRVALKVMRGGWTADSEGLRFFRREAQTLARLQHPGIAAIYEAGSTDDGQPFFAMELIRGVPLDRAFDTVAGSPGVASVATTEVLRARLDLFLEICDAIVYAHQRGVLHRDLKPSNILVTAAAASESSRGSDGSSPTSRGGRIKIVDFGLARISDSDVTLVASRSESRALQGTLPYMSPEQTLGRPEEIDFRSDLYSLGVILYRLLTGEPPYVVRSDAILEAVRTIREVTPRKAGSIAPLLRGDVETILAKALEKEPDRRYQSVEAFADDLRRFLSDQPILARSPSATYQLRKLAARHRAATALLATLFAVLVVSTVTMTILYDAQRRQRAIAVLEARKADRINQFLQEMLSSANPKSAPGRDLTVATMLDEAAIRVDSSLVTEPDVQAAIRLTIGNAYRVLGRSADAESQLTRALRTREELLGPKHPDVAEILSELANLYRLMDRLAPAESLARLANAVNAEVLGTDSDRLANGLQILSLIVEARGRHEEAESVALEAQAIMRRNRGENSAGYAAVLLNLGNIKLARGQSAAAESLCHEAIRIQSAVLAEKSPDVATAKNVLAVAVQRQGRLAEAESLFGEAIALTREVLGEHHPLLGARLFNLATTVLGQERYDDAEQLMLEAHEVLTTANGPAHSSVGRTTMGLAVIRSAKGEPAVAESLGRRGYEVMRQALGPESDDVMRESLSLAGVLRAAGHTKEAHALCRGALAHFQSRFGSDHATVASALHALGKCESALGHTAAAESLLTEGYRIRRKVLGPDHLLVASILEDIGRVAIEDNDPTAAESALREAHRIHARRLPRGDARTQRVARLLAEHLASTGRVSEAESIRASAVISNRAVR